MSTSKAIRQLITRLKAGKPFTPALFVRLGSRGAIDVTLMRLVKEGRVERLGRGVYVVPKTGRFGIKATPSAEEVARTVVEKEGATIGINGAEAARRFGFSTQMPTQSVFQTTGSPHKIRYGKGVIWLQHVAPKKLVLGERPAGQALAALWYLGREEVSAHTIQRLSERLAPGEFHALRGAQTSMPAWMASAMHAFEKQTATTI